MKKIVLISFLILISNLTIGQEKLEWLDVDAIIEKAALLESESNFNDAIKELNKIPKADSIYVSSLTSKTYYLINTEDYSEAVEVANEGLALKNHSSHFYFYVNKIAALIRLEEYKEALDVIDVALERYPKNYKIWHNKGAAFEGLEQYDQAILAYQQSIKYNPFYSINHLKLAILCYNEHLISQTMMCLNLYLLTNPDGDGSFNVLNSYNNMVKDKNESKPKGIQISQDDDSFEEIDLIINNYAALSKKYKVNNKLNLPIMKQNHALLGQLKEFEGNGGFWDTYYVPLFQFIESEGLFNEFMYTICYSVENEKYKSIVNKNISGIKSFIPKYQTEWLNIVGKGKEIVGGKLTDVEYFYNNSKVQAYGQYVNEKTIGEWFFINEHGGLTSYGSFNDAGEKEGEWTYYRLDGSVSESGSYTEGKVNGAYKLFHPNGKLRILATHKDDELHGLFEKYNQEGALIESVNYEDGEYEGVYKSFYPYSSDAVEYEVNYEKGKIVGDIKLYYPNNILKEQIQMNEGLRNGVYKRYFNTGLLEIEKKYIAGELSGEYIEYHINGEVYSKGMYADDMATGEWKTFYPNGKLESISNYEKGSMNGLFQRFDKDGALNYEYDYRKSEIIGYRFFDKKGELIKEGRKSKGEFFYEGHAPNGNITSEGNYDISGGKNGEWKFYSDNGNLNSVFNYKDDLVEGEAVYYHDNGKVFKKLNYENDLRQGYYEEYYPSGQMSQQGYYKDDMLEGLWIRYYQDGTITNKNYYNKGNRYGVAHTFSVDGKPVYDYSYFDGELQDEVYFEENGDIMEVIDVANAMDTLTLHYNNGVVNKTFKLSYGIRQGDYRSNYYSGELFCEGEYFNGDRHGMWKWFFKNGKLKEEGEYFYGNKEGEWKRYYENGKLAENSIYVGGNLHGLNVSYNEQGITTVKTDYFAGEKHGKTDFFSEDGKLQLTRYYTYGTLTGYSYLGKDGKNIDQIPVVNETAKIVSYFDNGKVSREMNIVKGSFEDEYLKYYYTGQLRERQMYKNDEREGEVIGYYPSGKVEYQRMYSGGELNGVSKEFHANGKLKEEVTYLNDTRTGEGKEYDNTGKLIMVTTYFDGQVVSESKM